MTVYLEDTHAGEFLVSEANGGLSRETITVISGQDLAAGTVLGLITASGKYTILAPGASDGSEVAAGVLYDAVDASTGDALGVAVVRLAEVNSAELVWPDGISAGQKATAGTQLATFTGTRGGVAVRTGLGTA